MVRNKRGNNFVCPKKSAQQGHKLPLESFGLAPFRCLRLHILDLDFVDLLDFGTCKLIIITSLTRKLFIFFFFVLSARDQENKILLNHCLFFLFERCGYLVSILQSPQTQAHLSVATMFLYYSERTCVTHTTNFAFVYILPTCQLHVASYRLTEVFKRQ